jgi:exonuclease III
MSSRRCLVDSQFDFMDSDRVMCWNVRDLNGHAHHDVVADFVRQEKVSLLSLQETKLIVIGDSLISDMLGSGFDYCYLQASGTRGGILLTWRPNRWSCSNMQLSAQAITIKVAHRAGSDPWWLTTVYRPHDDHEKVSFLDELWSLRAGRLGPWFLSSDFNIIYKATNKNNGRFNRRLMGKMRRFLQDMELLELHLQGHLYTWSNE